ncbi:MAG: hypothetical protein HZB26_12095 [Candidatus Hydrogenedentes bacterium]|nr:hypothetical protein [Candidatus Hydrogenedentota bacterium]
MGTNDRLRSGARSIVSIAQSAPCYLGMLYCAGIVHWVWFFLFAQLQGLDWRLTAGYQAVLRDALTRFRIPYVSTFLYYTDRYLGTPETPLSPQFLLTPWLSPWVFNVLNICLLYTAAFAGLLLLRRRYRLSRAPFALLFLLFNFNGYLVSRVGVGHTMWYGYFFLPFFYLFLLELFDRPDDRRLVVLLTGVLAAIELQGSFHLYVWCVMYLMLTALFAWRLFRPLAIVTIWASLLCAFRFVPTAVTFTGAILECKQGYPTLGSLLDSLIALATPAWVSPDSETGWWELDCFVGAIGLGLVGWFAVVYPHNAPSKWYSDRWALILAAACMAVFAMDGMYQPIFNLSIPFLDSQRVPTRFIVMPLTVCITLAAIQMQRFLDSEETRPVARWMLALALILVAAGLYRHSAGWTVREVELRAWENWRRPVERIAVLDPDMTNPGMRTYVHAVWASSVFSLALAAHWFYRLLRTRARQTSSAGN